MSKGAAVKVVFANKKLISRELAKIGLAIRLAESAAKFGTYQRRLGRTALIT